MTVGNLNGIYITWNNIDARIKDTQILSNCSGYCEPGTVLAIMGPSGAGKTTLLSILAGKTSKDVKVTGSVQANNLPYSTKQFYSFASFVFQNDILNEALTVKETLQFIAKLKIKNDQEAQNRVKNLINKFQLKKCQDTYVGGKVIKGISGGEKKRVCIAAQMVTEPKVIVLDEPTSGLDSHIANSVIKILKKVSQEGKTVILTIHQPSYKIYSQLDRLILLNKGQTIYQGKGDSIKSYMQNKLSITIPQNTTICDYFMFEISDYKLKKTNKETCLNYQSYKKQIEPDTKQYLQKISSFDLQNIQDKKTVRTMLEQFIILLMRQIKLFTRNPMRLGRSIGNSILTIVIVGLIFLHGISDDRPSPKQSGQSYDLKSLIIYFIYSQGLCFINTTSILMTGIFSVALVFPVERQVFSKETASKTYDALPYFLSKLIIEVLSLLASILVFASGSYWMMGFTAQFSKFVTFSKYSLYSALILCVLGFVGNSIGLMTGSLFKDAQRASAMAPALLLPLMTFSGLYNKLNDIPSWIAWMQYISPFRYGLHALLLNQFSDEQYLIEGTTFIFDYRDDLAINLSLSQNILVLLSLATLFYTLAFIFLKNLSANISA